MRAWLLVLVACHRDPAPATVGNRAAVPADAARAPTTCERYDALVAKALACPALAQESRDEIAQTRAESYASLAKKELELDPDEICGGEIEEVRRIAGQACHL